MLDKLIEKLYNNRLGGFEDIETGKRYCLLEEPMLVVNEKEYDEWGDENHTYISVRTFVPGQLLWEGMIEVNKNTWGVMVKTIDIELEVREEEIKLLREAEKNSTLKYELDKRKIISQTEIKYMPEFFEKAYC